MNNIAGATNQVYNATMKGNYKVNITASNGCSNTSKGVKVTSSCKQTSIDDPLIAALNCYPNPSQGPFTLELKSTDTRSRSVKVEVINIFNQEVYSEVISISNGELKLIIGANSLPVTGMYTVRVTDGIHVFSDRVMIQQ